MKNILFVLVFLNGLFFSSIIFTADISDSQKALLDTLPPDQRESILVKMRQSEDLKEELEKTFEEVTTTSERPEKKKLSEKESREYQEDSKNWIYGYEIFQTSPTTFAPAPNIPIPPTFTLGPGDKLKIEYYGNENDSVETFISRNGTVNLPKLGPVVLSGLTFAEAKQLIEKEASTELFGTEVFVTLSELRSITVYVLGEAYKPGSYTISSLSTLTNLLFVSGGVNETGSVRNIKVKRDGKEVHNFDLYDLLLRGDTSTDVRLLDGDVIFVPLFTKSGRVEGSFRRPGLYELTEKDTIGDLISYAGGFESGAGSNARLELSRINIATNKREIFSFSSDEKDIISSITRDDDTLAVSGYSALEPASVTIEGQVKFPGAYSIEKGDTLLAIIEKSGGLTQEAYSLGTVFLREEVAKQQKLSFDRQADFLEGAIAEALTSGTLKNIDGDSLRPISMIISRLRDMQPLGRISIDADLMELRANPQKDFLLKDGDKIFIPERPSAISVAGEVFSPSTHTYDSNTTIVEYISKSGGFMNTADERNIYVILPDGASFPVERRMFSSRANLIPGSIIVIPRNPRPFDWLVMTTQLTPIFANLATSAAALAAVSD